MKALKWLLDGLRRFGAWLDAVETRREAEDQEAGICRGYRKFGGNFEA